jgi:hypothetical protein
MGFFSRLGVNDSQIRQSMTGHVPQSFPLSRLLQPTKQNVGAMFLSSAASKTVSRPVPSHGTDVTGNKFPFRTEFLLQRGIGFVGLKSSVSTPFGTTKFSLLELSIFHPVFFEGWGERRSSLCR